MFEERGPNFRESNLIEMLKMNLADLSTPGLRRSGSPRYVLPPLHLSFSLGGNWRRDRIKSAQQATGTARPWSSRPPGFHCLR
jgi:hypothetical protein